LSNPSSPIEANKQPRGTEGSSPPSGSSQRPAVVESKEIHKSKTDPYPQALNRLRNRGRSRLQSSLGESKVRATRRSLGRRLVVLVGTHRTLAIAVKNDRVEARFTQLASSLRSEQQ